MSWLLAMFIATADAGKLSEGFRGLPFGPDSIISEPPLTGCTKNVQSPDDWSWICKSQINGVPVIVMYAASHGYFYAVTALASDMTGSGGLLNARRLREGAISAWGAGVQRHENDPKTFPDWFWLDGAVGALFMYNPIRDQSTLTLTDTAVKKQRDAAAARAARASSGDF